MTFKDLLKKHEKAKEDATPAHPSNPGHPPDFTFVRSTTNSQEIIEPPSFESNHTPEQDIDVAQPAKRFSRFRSSSNASTTSRTSKGEKRLSSKLHLRSHSHASSINSANVPADLPTIDSAEQGEEKEAKWEERATLLAQVNANNRSRSSSLQDRRPRTATGVDPRLYADQGDPPAVVRNAGDVQGDVDIPSQSPESRAKRRSRS